LALPVDQSLTFYRSNHLKPEAMTHRIGRVIGKRNKYGFLGSEKCFIQVQYDQKFDRLGHDKHEYEVNKELFRSIIVGAFVRGAFQQAPEGLKPVNLF
jgi:hypothetical protein